MLTPLVQSLALLLPFQDHDTQVSPFDGLRWSADQPEVQIEAEWYRPLEIDEIPLAKVLRTIDARWPGQREKRFAEDLVEALDLLDWEGDLFVELDLVRLRDQAEVRLESIEMTRDKRNALRDAATANRPRLSPPPAPERLTHEELNADLVAFQSGLERRFAYLGLRNVELSQNLAEIAARAQVAGSIATAELAQDLHRILMRFSDGHARVSAPTGLGQYEGRHTPFLLDAVEGGVVAYLPDRSALLDPQRPYVVSIDGMPLSTWTAAASMDVVQGSPQAVEFRSLRALRQIEKVRGELGLPSKDTLLVALTSAKGGDVRELELSLRESRPTYGTWPDHPSRMLEGNLGYLRISAMDDSVSAVRASMAEFEDSNGLIVDVRGNGGGSREILLALGGYLIGPEDAPVVANIAAYRDGGDFTPEHLVARFMYEADWEGWSAAQRTAIDRAARSFKPEWSPEQPMSRWHYLVLDRTGHPDEYHYNRSVVVLSDAGCFSATDIFLGAFELFPSVTLMGTPSSGGSARTQRFRLPQSGIEVRCASMASYRPNGRLYDGRGIEVDVEVKPAPMDFIHDGSDSVLDSAVEFLKGS